MEEAWGGGRPSGSILNEKHVWIKSSITQRSQESNKSPEEAKKMYETPLQYVKSIEIEWRGREKRKKKRKEVDDQTVQFKRKPFLDIPQLGTK